MTSPMCADVPDKHFLLNTLSIIYFWKPQAKLSSMMPNIISKRSKKTKVAKVGNVPNVLVLVASSASTSVSITTTAKTITLS